MRNPDEIFPIDPELTRLGEDYLRLARHKDHNSSFRAHAGTGRIEHMKRLLRLGADPNAPDPVTQKTALMVAAEKGLNNVALFIMDIPGIDLFATQGARGPNAAQIAKQHGKDETANLIMDRMEKHINAVSSPIVLETKPGRRSKIVNVGAPRRLRALES